MFVDPETLEKLYKLFPWPEDPSSPEGKARYESALSFFRELLGHPWLSELVSRPELSIVDVCGGTGIGGVALAKALSEKGIGVRLFVVDARESALSLAESFGRAELGVPVEVRRLDARELHTMGVSFDLALLYGLSTPHFDAFSMVELIASVAESLKTSGLFLLEEADRFYTITVQTQYRHAFYEGDEKRGVLSFHIDYDPVRGVVKRLWLNPFTGERATVDLRLWDLASTLALSWLFFEDIDFVAYPGKRYSGMVMARRPRRKLSPADLRPPLSRLHSKR